MGSVFLGLVIFSIFGIVMLTTQGFGTTLDSVSEVNKIGTLKISDYSSKTLMGLNLGTADNITSITLTFKNSIVENSDVNILLKDNNGLEIGSGFKTVSPSSDTVTITLSNSITALERSTLQTASITIT